MIRGKRGPRISFCVLLAPLWLQGRVNNQSVLKVANSDLVPGKYEGTDVSFLEMLLPLLPHTK